MSEFLDQNLVNIARAAVGLPVKSSFIPTMGGGMPGMMPPMPMANVPPAGDPMMTGIPADLSPPPEAFGGLPQPPQTTQQQGGEQITLGVDSMVRILEAVRGGGRGKSQPAAGDAGPAAPVAPVAPVSPAASAPKAAGMNMGKPSADFDLEPLPVHGSPILTEILALLDK